jgi:hypothetical protein
MRRLRPTDGTPSHRRATRYHIAACRTVDTPLHHQLRAEVAALYDDIKAKARGTEDAEDDFVDASAEVDFTEIALENVIRDIDGDLAKLDREHPGLNAQYAVFPHGYGEVIDPENEAQLSTLPALHVRLDPFKAKAGMAKLLAKLDAAEAAFKTALDAEAKAMAAVDTAFAAEHAARRAIREQFESAYGRLRDFYKSRPAQAEQFFSREGSARRPPKGGPAGSEPGAGAGSGGGASGGGTP